MKFKAKGIISVYLTAEFEDDGTSIGDQAHWALSNEAEDRGIEGFHVINYEFDRVEGGKQDD